MPRVVSNDLKARIPILFRNGYTIKRICSILGLKKSLVNKVLDHYARHGVVYNPSTYSGVRRRRRILTAADENFIFTVVQHRRTIYLDELQQELRDKRHIHVSIPTLRRALQRLQITRKVVSASAAERNEELRALYMNRIGAEAPDANMLVFTDGAAKNKRTCARRYGRSPVGQHCQARQPFVRGVPYTILPAITLDGVIAYDIIEGPVDGERFLQFLKDQIVRTSLFCISMF